MFGDIIGHHGLILPIALAIWDSILSSILLVILRQPTVSPSAALVLYEIGRSVSGKIKIWII